MFLKLQLIIAIAGVLFSPLKPAAAIKNSSECFQPQGDMKMDQPKIIVYTASYCPFCTKAKKLLDMKKVVYQEIDVTDPTTRDHMIERSGGRKTIPQIFIENKHVGGFDDLNALDRAGDLDKLLGR